MLVCDDALSILWKAPYKWMYAGRLRIERDNDFSEIEKGLLAMGSLFCVSNASLTLPRKLASDAIFNNGGYLFHSWESIIDQGVLKGTPTVFKVAPLETSVMLIIHPEDEECHRQDGH